MVLEWLSKVWQSQRVDPQLYKFTPEFTYETNMENISSFFNRLSNFSHAKEAVNRINQQRSFDLSFIDSQIKTLESIKIPELGITPKFTSYERYGKRAKQGEVYDRPYSYGSGGGVYRWWFVNPQRKLQYEREVSAWNQTLENYDIYKSETLGKIADNISFLGKQRDLIPSQPFSL
jgi:hypothetical protein